MLRIDVRSLNKDLEKFRKQMDESAREVIADYIFDFMHSLAQSTPVGNTAPPPEGYLRLYELRQRYQGLRIQEGYAMGNWRVTFRPTGSAVAVYETNPEVIAVKAFERITDSYKLGSPIYIVNNAPYINRLNEGYSQQAEAGFIDAIVQQYRTFGKYTNKFNQLMKGA